jgi:AsmA protein
MKILRIVGFSALGLVVVLLIGVGVLYAMFDGPRIKQQLAQVVKDQKQRTLSIPGELGLSVWPNIALTMGKASLSERNSDQPFVSLDSARVSVALLPLLSRQVSVNALELGGLKATVVQHKDGSFNFSDLLSSQSTAQSTSSTAPPAAAEPLQIDVAAVKLSNAQLLWIDEKKGTRSTLSHLDLSTARLEANTATQRYSANKVEFAAKGQTGADTFDVRLQVPRLVLEANVLRGEALTMVTKLSGNKRAAYATLVLSGIQGSTQALAVNKMDLELDASADKATLKGRLSTPLAVNITDQTIDLAALAGKLDITHPSLPMKQLSLPLAGHARIDLAKSTANVGLKTQLDESKIAFSAGVSQFAPLSLGFDLDIDQLNLDKYLPPADTTGAAQADAGAAPQADPKVDLSALAGLNLSGNLKVGALQVSNVKLSQVQAKLSVLGGQLSIAPFSANLYQGSISGSLNAQAAGNAIAVKQTLTGVSVGPLLKDVANKDMLEGRGNVALDVTTHGPTVGALKKALAGSASLSLKEGAIKGINLAKSFRELKAKLGGGSDATQAVNSKDKTEFSELSGTFKIAAGVARNDDLVMKSPFLRLGGAGDIDMGNSQLNYLAKASVVNTEAGQGGKDLDQLKGLTIPVRLSGPFSNPSYKIEFGSFISDAAKAKVQAQAQEKKKEVKQKVEDALKDKLKGLLGR